MRTLTILYVYFSRFCFRINLTPVIPLKIPNYKIGSNINGVQFITVLNSNKINCTWKINTLALRHVREVGTATLCYQLQTTANMHQFTTSLWNLKFNSFSKKSVKLGGGVKFTYHNHIMPSARLKQVIIRYKYHVHNLISVKWMNPYWTYNYIFDHNI